MGNHEEVKREQNNNLKFIIIFTAIRLLPGGSGYFTCIQNTKFVITKFKWEECSGNLESWEPSKHLLLGTGKPFRIVYYLDTN